MLCVISVWADADTWFERQQQEEEMKRIEAENRAAMQAAEDLHRKQVAEQREGEKEEEIEIKDDPMAKAEAEVLQNQWLVKMTQLGEGNAGFCYLFASL